MSDPNPVSQRAQQMFAIIEQYLGSGLTQKTFCEQEGVARSTFELWLKKYRQAQNLPAKIPSVPKMRNNSFIPLTVKPPETEIQPTRYVIEFPNGVVVRLSGAVPPQMLAHLIQTVGG